MYYPVCICVDIIWQHVLVCCSQVYIIQFAFVLILLRSSLCCIWVQFLLDGVGKIEVSDQNGVSLLYIMLEIHHSGREPSKCEGVIVF